MSRCGPGDGHGHELPYLRRVAIVRAQEHRELADAASGGATVELATGDGARRLRLSFGDVVALSADYFVANGLDATGEGQGVAASEDLASGGLFQLAAVPGQLGTRLGTSDEIVAALRVMAADQMTVDSRFEKGGEFAAFNFNDDDAKAVERRVRDRFLALGASNDDHFVDPGQRGWATEADRPRARYGSATLAYRHLHRRALDEAHRQACDGGRLEVAMAHEAAAQHHLTDAFAAGHLRTPVAEIREYWQQRYPGFWDGLRQRVAADTAATLKEMGGALGLLPEVFLRRRALAAVWARTAEFPRVSLGDLLAKVFHDWDNVHGLALEGGGMVFGDGCLEQGVTKELALGAARAGLDDVEVAFDLGRSNGGLNGEALYQAVRSATGAESEHFVAETWIPVPSADTPAQNWRAADFESLWETPMVGSTGTTVGQAVCEALEPGEELPRRLGGLGDSLGDSIGVVAPAFVQQHLGRRAGEAYQRGFIAKLEEDPRAAVMAVIDAGGGRMVVAGEPGMAGPG